MQFEKQCSLSQLCFQPSSSVGLHLETSSAKLHPDRPPPKLLAFLRRVVAVHRAIHKCIGIPN